MEVKVHLGQKSPVILTENKVKVFFTHFFDKIGISLLEPLCPFCHRRLKGAHCYCQKFEKNARKFLGDYKREGLYLTTIPNVENISFFSLDAKKLSAKPEIEFSKVVPLFDQGTIARSGREVWFVSVGELENGVLRFWVRQKGSAEAWHCKLENVSLQLPDLYVAVCHNETQTQSYGSGHGPVVLGRYLLTHKQTEIDKLSYAAFLEQLKKID